MIGEQKLTMGRMTLTMPLSGALVTLTHWLELAMVNYLLSTAKCANVAKMCHKVNPIFGCSLALSRMNRHYTVYYNISQSAR